MQFFDHCTLICLCTYFSFFSHYLSPCCYCRRTFTRVTLLIYLHIYILCNHCTLSAFLKSSFFVHYLSLRCYYRRPFTINISIYVHIFVVPFLVEVPALQIHQSDLCRLVSSHNKRSSAKHTRTQTWYHQHIVRAISNKTEYVDTNRYR